MVIEQNRIHRLRPRVIILMNKNRKPMSSGKYLDLTKVPDSGTKRKARWITGGLPLGELDIEPQKAYFE